MEVDSPTQHSPIYVDVQSHYRVTFDNMKYLPVNKHWEIAVKLEDKKEDHVLGETNILWPHTDPPHTIIYDSEHSLLHWENNESLAYLPIQIPSRPVYDISAPHTTKSNSKILIRPSLSSDPAERSAVKIARETQWKELVTSKKFLKKSKDEFDAIKHKFNPLFEDRLTPEQQQKALNLIQKNYKLKNVQHFLRLLLDMSFFDLSSLNAFIVDQCSIIQKVVPRDKKAKKKPQENGVSTAHINGTSTITEAGDKTSNDNEPKAWISSLLVEVLLKNDHVVLCDNAFVALLRCCAKSKQKNLRHHLIYKNLPLDAALRRRIFKELENEAIVSLLEFYTLEYIASVGVNSELVEKVLDLLLFITNGFNDKLLWQDTTDFTKRINRVLGVLKTSTAFSLAFNKTKSVQKLCSTINCSVVPSTDYKRSHTKFNSYVISNERKEKSKKKKKADDKEEEE